MLNLKRLLLFLPLCSLCSCLTPILEDKSYDTKYNYNVNNTVEYILTFYRNHSLSLYFPPRVTITSDNADNFNPLMIVTTQPEELLSWKLPMAVEGDEGITVYYKTARTLCYDILRHNQGFGEEIMNNDSLIVTISSASPTNISFDVIVESQTDFYINPSQEYNFTISPSESKYFFYNFTTNETLTSHDSNFDTVILEVTSPDTVCMTVSIQNISCPVFDSNEDITFRGFYETVNTKGGITIPKYKFPYGFYVVFVAKGDDVTCNGNLDGSETNRTKTISLLIKPSITYDDYIYAVVATLCCIGGFYVVFGLAFFVCSSRNYIPRNMEYVTDTPSTANPPSFMGDSISDDIEYDTLLEANYDRGVILAGSHLFLSDLARKDPRIHRQKSYLYLYNVLTIALFYGLPVVQLVVTYQNVLNQTGEQDLCYYNFLCAHPWGLISDFNHLFSNIAYVLLGILFIWITFTREYQHKDVDFDRAYGIPQHYGMFYAMGVALIMEGVLSGSYHVCPNSANFQFDSSFMYVMAVLCMVKLYQNRHPDINATAYATFGVLALAILLGMIGILEMNLGFQIFFTVVYLLMCVYLSLTIYFLSPWKLNCVTLKRVCNALRQDYASGFWNIFKLKHMARFILLLLGNLVNWALAAFGLYYIQNGFGLFLLGIFMANTMLYFCFYIVMKVLHKERVNALSLLFLFCSVSCAVSAMYFFLHKSISWSDTPARSRQFNQECKLLRFYDFHDIWHFLSAIGMFFTFMVLLTLDDDLSHTHRSQISVF